jgi:hypothetical protein
MRRRRAKTAYRGVGVTDRADGTVVYEIWVDGRWRTTGAEVARDAADLRMGLVDVAHERGSVEREIERLANQRFIELAAVWRRRTIPACTRREVWERDEGRCVRCGGDEGLAMDHVIPFSEGGSDAADNLQLLCAPCHCGKGTRTLDFRRPTHA